MDATRTMFSEIDRFIMLGQSKDAIGVLDSRIKREPSDRDSWIKLMAIYRDEDMKDDFYRTYATFREQFGESPASRISEQTGTDPNGTYLAIRVGWAEQNEAQLANACHNHRPHFLFARFDPPPPFSDQYRRAALRCIVGLHIMRSAPPTGLHLDYIPPMSE